MVMTWFCYTQVWDFWMNWMCNQCVACTIERWLFAQNVTTSYLGCDVIKGQRLISHMWNMDALMGMMSRFQSFVVTPPCFRKEWVADTYERKTGFSYGRDSDDWHNEGGTCRCIGILPYLRMNVLVRASFFRLGGPHARTVVLGKHASWCYVIWYLILSSHLISSMFFACCVGEAQNPGPTSHNLIRIAVVNPTAVHQKVGKIMKLNADIIALSETSATHAVQSQVNKDLIGCGFHAFWSATVSSKKYSADNRPSLRGEALGSALFTHLPARKPRSGFNDMLWETQRISMAIVRLGGREVLFISIYGFANRYRERKKTK